MDSACRKAGIMDAQSLRDMGADAAYAKLLQSGLQPHFISYYVLVMGLQGRPWNDCQGAEKAALRTTFDALKATDVNGGKDNFERMMNLIGVVQR